MNKSESKYFNTAVRMNEAFLELLDKKDFEYITVKEICEKAGVNRSTFYLHYENISDLLHESMEYIDKQFLSYFPEDGENRICAVRTTDLWELYFITPEYLIPYLEYVKAHKRLFKVAIKKSVVLESEKRFNLMFQHIFNPIMDRFHVLEEKRPFMIAFYVEGIIGIIKKWINEECKEPVNFIAEIIMEHIEKPKEMRENEALETEK